MEKLNIICVDDQLDVLNALLQDLDPLASWLKIELCGSAYEVLDLMDDLHAQGEHIALVLADHVMPGKTGVDLLAEVAQDSRFRGTKKILLTGQASHTDTVNAINAAGINHYFEKPWAAKALVDCVRHLVTEYIFEQGLDYSQSHGELDQKVVLSRLR